MKNYTDDELGPINSFPKRKGRKTKKQLEKEIMLEYEKEKKEDESMLNKSYNMMQHLSSKEKRILKTNLQNLKIIRKKDTIIC